MEFNLADFGAVDVGLGFGEAAEDLAGLLLDAWFQVCGGDAGVDVGVGVVVAAVFDFEVDQASVDQAATDSLITEFPGGQVQLAEFGEEAGFVQTGVK